MYSLNVTSETTEGRAYNAFFDACRDNPLRLPKNNVFFTWLYAKTWHTKFYSEEGKIIADAIIDEFDC